MRLPTSRLGIARKKNLLTQVDVAIATGIPTAIVSEIERGTRRATPDEAEAIARVVGVPVQEVFDHHAEVPPSESKHGK